MEPFKIHSDLKLGVATAATQIEGGDQNNSFYEFSLIKGRIKDDTTPFVANQHYRKYKLDTKLMSDMHIQVYRMSIEWSRIEPKLGEFDSTAMQHYIDEIMELNLKGIKVLVTLHHFSNPIWFEKKKAFLDKNNNKYFEEYVDYVSKHLNGIAYEFCTINEPNIYAFTSYFQGVWPPAHKSVKEAKIVMRNLAHCHVEAYKILHKNISDCRVGFANHLVYFAPKNKRNLFDRLEAKSFANMFQDSIMKAMAYGKRTRFLGSIGEKSGKYYDFIGINYYLRNVVHKRKVTTDENAITNDLGWEIYPEGLRKLCEKEHKIFKSDIYVTENGTCDHKDEFRSKYIYDHIKAISDLEFVKAYYHWTFIDNWEWAEGQTAKFGLVDLDYKSQVRTVRESGHMYTDLIDSGGVTQEMIDKYLN